MHMVCHSFGVFLAQISKESEIGPDGKSYWKVTFMM